MKTAHGRSIDGMVDGMTGKFAYLFPIVDV